MIPYWIKIIGKNLYCFRVQCKRLKLYSIQIYFGGAQKQKLLKMYKSEVIEPFWPLNIARVMLKILNLASHFSCNHFPYNFTCNQNVHIHFGRDFSKNIIFIFLGWFFKSSLPWSKIFLVWFNLGCFKISFGKEISFSNF